MSSVYSTITTAIEIAKNTKIPFLFMSSFGFGKTTIIKKWAAENDYHCEILNGARFEPEAVEGYQVNEPGKEALVHKNPSWFQRIWDKEKEGIHSILFCDELSGGRTQTQNALLNLLDGGRTIGENKCLPESTIVIAASNYADNVPENCITSGNLNRFCIVNLLEDVSQFDIVDEFLTDVDEKASIKFEKTELDDETKTKLNEKIHIMFKEAVKSYSDRDSSKGFIDMRAPIIQDLYKESPQGELYNFISGRTMSMMSKFITSYFSLGINDSDFLKKCTRGFIGIGTGHFINRAQVNSFNSVIDNSVKSIISEIRGSLTAKKDKSFDLYGKENISTTVAKITSSSEEIVSLVGDSTSEKETLKEELAKQIKEKYMTIAENLSKIEKDPKFRSEFFTDFESILELLHKEEFVPEEIVTFAQCYDAYYSQLIGKSLFPNVSTQGAFKNYSSSLYRCSILALKDGEKLPKTAKEIFEFVKNEKIIQVGITQNYSKKLYKMLYFTKVHGDNIFDTVDGYSPIFFNKDKKLEVKDWATVREEAMLRK